MGRTCRDNTGERGRSIRKSGWSKAISLTPWTRREQGRRRQARFQLGEEAGPKHELWGLKQINDEDVVNYFTQASRRLNYYHRIGLPRPDMRPSKAVQRSLGGFVFGGSFTNDLPAGLQYRTRAKPLEETKVVSRAFFSASSRSLV